MSLHINGGPGPVKEVKRMALGSRWCFRCRARAEFVTIVRAYDCAPEVDYYGPWASIECEHGHDDGDLFPGRFREWEA